MMRAVFLVFALWLTPPGLPSGGFHWQRVITPPRGAGLGQACVVLDAATFANAAPALRDLRLFQDGAELPYAVEESYDARALASGVTPEDDRSAYETAVVADLRPLLPGISPGDGVERNSRTHELLRPGEVDPFLGFYGVTELPPRVPVERLRLEPAPVGGERVHVIAREMGGSAAETVEGRVDAAHPVLPLTLGANLQKTAELTVMVEESGQVERRAVFEMRRRSLCYQPRSGSPLMLYLGGGEGMAAKTYSYASTFSTAVERPYGMLGPLEPNPEKTVRREDPRGWLRLRLLVGVVFLLAMGLLLRRGRWGRGEV